MINKTACSDRTGLGLLSLGTMLLVAAGFFATAPARAADYYVSSQGSDQADGKSPASAWRTLARVNGSKFEPGDKILLRRGDAWREQIFPHSGSEAGCITYGAYGTGEKPLLLGSVRKNVPADWREEGPNIWMAGEVKPLEPELLKNPSFAADSAGWSLYCEAGASAKGDRDAETFDSAPAGYTIRCAKAGTNGSHIQWSTMGLPVVKDTTYRLAFRVKASKPFWLPAPVLMQQGAPWENYDPAAASSVGRVREEWTSQVRFYRCRKTDPSARLTFFLGKCLPEGASLSIDSLSFAPCDANAALACDVGNIIFSGEKFCGRKKFKPADLKVQGDYWYDPDTRTVKVFSEKNPAVQYSDVECALRQHIVDESGARYVVFENLAMKYGAAHGFGGGNTHHITIRDCDISFIGGGKQNSDERTVRFGNGIEFWGNAHDNLVERCRLWEIYDAALTNQNTGETVKQYNITYRRNVIWNSEYSFEYWNRPENSQTDNIVFEYNTCVNAGVNWGHDQRPDPSGRHLCFYSSSAAESNVIIRNNIFYEATKHAFYGQSRTRASMAALRIDQNCWYQPAGTMIHLKDADYTMDRFAAYQAETGKEQKSIAADPKLADVKRLDFHLTKESPCIDANMGAYEFKKE